MIHEQKIQTIKTPIDEITNSSDLILISGHADAKLGFGNKERGIRVKR